MLNFSKKLAAVTAFAIGLLTTSGANATVYTFGDLTTDDTTQLIHNTATGRAYTRLDAFDYTYAQTITAVGSGGTWDGWSIMTANVADQFVASLLGTGSTACSGQVSYGTYCGTVSNWADDRLGSSYVSLDYFAYLNSYGGEGLVEISNDGTVRDYEDWASLGAADGYSGSQAINYVLYKDNYSSNVPEPGSLALLGLGLAGLGFNRRRKQKLVV